MDIVEKYRKMEEAKLNWLKRIWRDTPTYYSAKDINPFVLPYYNAEQDHTVKPFRYGKIADFLVICCLLFFWIIYLSLVLSKTLLPVSMIFLLVMTSVIGFVIWTFFFNPKYPNIIIFKHEAIIIGKEMIEWNRIKEYLIKEKLKGRSREYILVLFIDNEEIVKKSLRKLNIKGKEILKLIEVYKRRYDSTKGLNQGRLLPGYELK